MATEALNRVLNRSFVIANQRLSLVLAAGFFFDVFFVQKSL